jgi:hypothetical protein
LWPDAPIVKDAGMVAPLEILTGTDWSRLEHAYGSADGLADQLIGLLSGDPEVAGDVLGVLDAAVLHQGTIYSCTAPVALFVAGVLTDERTGVACESSLPWDDRVRPLRAALLEWLGEVGDSAAYSGNARDAVRACRAIRPQLYRAVAPFVWDPVASVRTEALGAAGTLLLADDLADVRHALAERLMEDASRTGASERAHLALVLDRWGIAPRTLLTDPEPGVRAYAAVARHLDGDPAALAEVRAALCDPDAVNHWFDGHHPQRGGWFLDTLVGALLRRTTAFDEIEPEATAIAMAPDSYARQCSVRSLMPRAFPPGRPDSPAAKRFRAALDRN